MNSTAIHNNFIKAVEQVSSEINVDIENDYSTIGGIFNAFSKNENSLKIIINLTNFQILSISDNLETLTGFTKGDYERENISMFLYSIKSDYAMTLKVLTQWAIHTISRQTPNTDFQALKLIFCGANIKMQSGQTARTLIRLTPLVLSENGYPNIGVLSIDVIEHLIKPDAHIWGLISYGDSNTNKYHILSTDKKYQYQDILSSREKDVLKLVSEGLESKEIAKRLFISLNTVVNHRRNAVTRTGARDTTGLIQICKMCGII